MTYSSPMVETAVKLLNYLKGNSDRQKSLAEACTALDIPRSTGFTIMKTLERNNFVKFDPETKRYSLGWALVELGAKASEQMTDTEVIRPYLRDLGQETGLTCILSQRVAEQVMIVEKVEPPGDVRVAPSVGNVYPLVASAVGKAFLAYMEDAEIHSLIARHGLRVFTLNSITDVEVYLRQLAEVRRLGFATSLEEFALGVNVVASPIFDASGTVKLTVAILGLTPYLPNERIREFGGKALNAARLMTSALGGVWRGQEVT
ncbi:MAG: IclR family transcriptional regulator [Chloroflexi bacterium]|nr:IclR family transcriptional regulator [Chloroflexota bacterium]